MRLSAGHDGPLNDWSERVDGEEMSGPEIVERIAWEFSVGPRVLLAFVEARSGWVTGAPCPTTSPATDYPAGKMDPYRSGLCRQLSWLADRLNGGYYDWKTSDNRVLTLADGVHLARARIARARLVCGATGTRAAVDRGRAAKTGWRRSTSPTRRCSAVRGSARSTRLEQATSPSPRLSLPWARGETWWLTGGPHGGWADGSAWSAVDFVPDDEARGCYVSKAWTTAVADGVVLGGGAGQMWLDLDGDGRRRDGSGRVLPAPRERRPCRRGHEGSRRRSARPSVVRGRHVERHARAHRPLIDGEWLAAAADDPMVLGGWTAFGSPGRTTAG